MLLASSKQTRFLLCKISPSLFSIRFSGRGRPFLGGANLSQRNQPGQLIPKLPASSPTSSPEISPGNSPTSSPITSRSTALTLYEPRTTALTSTSVKPSEISHSIQQQNFPFGQIRDEKTLLQRIQTARPDLFDFVKSRENKTFSDTISSITTVSVSTFFEMLISTYPNSSKDYIYPYITKNAIIRNLSLDNLETRLTKHFPAKNLIQYNFEKLIEKINIIEKTESWTKEKEKLLNKIRSFLDKHYSIPKDFKIPLNRDQQEYNSLYLTKRHTLTDWEQEVRSLLQEQKKKHPRIPPDCEHNIQLENKFITLLKDVRIHSLYKKDQPVWHEIIRRAGVTSNIDASPTMEEVLDDNNPSTMYKPYCLPILEGQGSKVVRLAYDIMSKKPQIYFQRCDINFNQEDIEEIFNKIMRSEIKVGTLRRRDLDVPYLSGDDLHCLGTIQYKGDYIAFTTLTSSNDGKTIKFGDKQYANKNVQDRGKAEYFRVLTFLVHIPASENIFLEEAEHTDLVNQNNYGDKAVREVLREAVHKEYKIWGVNMIRKPITFNEKSITELALSMCESRRNDLQKYNNSLITDLKWDKLSDQEKKEKALERNKINVNATAQKEESEYRKTLPKNIRDLFQTRDLLEKQKSNHDKNVVKGTASKQKNNL